MGTSVRSDMSQEYMYRYVSEVKQTLWMFSYANDVSHANQVKIVQYWA